MIAKLLFKVSLIVGVLVAVPYVMMGKGEMPDFLTGFFDKKPETVKLPENLSSVTTDSKVTVYQWVDEKGIKQFSSTPPPGQANVDTIKLSPNTNVVKAINVPEEEEKPKQGPQVTNILKSPYSVDGVKGMMEDSKGVQETMNKRMEEQQKLLDSLTGQGKH